LEFAANCIAVSGKLQRSLPLMAGALICKKY